MTDSTFDKSWRWFEKQINCPKHGVHGYIITSTISGYEGHWCQLCQLESMGDPLPLLPNSSSEENTND